ncbi:MAG: flagellar motor switch protein FliM [Geobacteraceae bacterium GWC2_55_20]|nr:MAG: flagellar motor switch protein FliM [Geobacteraceae bacterium GWC2_55_20]OGU24773.1 MAG: flagellar motor switch protein FliM [Geobacteraceae bacterium GWF2_54_21]HBA71344.1 flagellar motor switch protein FliM [Geobacter sp.]HCE68755.1 flagellar motor switch protein FliM [Geobacter sp.]
MAAAEKILTKAEIEALLNAVFDGRIEPEKELAKTEGSVVTYDLFNSEAHKGFVPNLDIIYDSYIRYSRVTLSNRLRKSVEIKKIGARSYKFDDFLQTLPSPVCMGIFKIEPLKGAALISFDSTLVLSLVDSLLGGTGSAKVPVANRMFTSIELRLMEKIVGDVLQDLEKAWAPLYATHMNLLRMEMNPRLISIVPPEYQIVTMSLKLQIEDISGNIMFAIPYMTIDPIRDKLKAGMQFDLMAIDPQWSSRLSAEILEAPMETIVEMGNARITLRELLELVPGDTIMLDKPSSGEMLVKVEGVPKYFGIPGIRHGNKAIQISKICSNRGQ